MFVRSPLPFRRTPATRLRVFAAAGLIVGLLASAGAAHADLYVGQAATRDNLGQTTTSGATTDAPALYTATDGSLFALSQSSNAGGGSVRAQVSALEGGAGASTLLRYLLTLVGPAGDPVGVNVQANGFVHGSGVNLYSGENLYSAQALFLLRTSSVVQASADTRFPAAPQSFALNTTAFFTPNFGYYVDLSAQATAGAPHGYLSASTAEAFVDPIFTVDPAFAGLYHFVGIPVDVTSAIPEPSTWAVMILGFAVLGAALRSRHRTPRPAVG